MKRGLRILLGVLLIVSLGTNLFLINYIATQNAAMGERAFVIHDSANSRATYFSVHNITAAHELATGAGIKVGVLDTGFGTARNPDLYAGGRDFADRRSDYEDWEHHGYWMALTLREVAPDVEIYALGIPYKDEAHKVAAVVQAVDWAIQSGIDVLTYSSGAFASEHKELVEEAVERAVVSGIVITFIHESHLDNLLPGTMLMGSHSAYDREPDLFIYPFDYNITQVARQREYRRATVEERLRMTAPYTSVSSTAVVTAGLVAMLKEINNSLDPNEYRQILIETSRQMVHEGVQFPKVPDAFEAIQRIADVI